MKEISKEEIRKLVNKNHIRNSKFGYVDKRGFKIGFYRTRNKRYIEDMYADIASNIK